jgi:hypothetical protein
VELLVCSPGKFGFHQPTGQNYYVVIPTAPAANGWVSLKARPGVLQVYHTQIPNGGVSISRATGSLLMTAGQKYTSSSNTPGPLDTSQMIVTATARADMHMMYSHIQVPGMSIVIAFI